MAYLIRYVKSFFMRESAVSVNIPSALRSLRSALGESQEGMARRLGCSTSGYVKWERGVAEPSASWLLKAIQLCPDANSLSKFGISIVRHDGEKDGKPEGVFLAAAKFAIPKSKR